MHRKERRELPQAISLPSGAGMGSEELKMIKKKTKKTLKSK